MSDASQAPAPAPSEPALRLTLDWLEIRQYRNVEPTRLEFSKGHNVILGINGTGKTQLLELIGALASADLSFLRTELYDIDLSFALSLGTEQVVFTVLRIDDWDGIDETNRNVHVYVEGPGGRNEDIGQASGPVGATAPDLVSDAMARPAALLVRRLGMDEAWSDALFSRLAGHRRFDEALGYFHQLTSRADGAPPSLIVTLFDGKPGYRRSSAPGVAPTLGWILRSVIVPPASPSPFADPTLDDFARLAGYLGGEVTVSLLTSVGTGQGTRFEYSNPEFAVTRGANRITDSLLSFGEKRLLAFLFYCTAADLPGGIDVAVPVIADELTNGMHHAWVDACMDCLAGRQTFLATQSPLLLDRVWVDSPAHAKSMFVVCRRDQDRLTWTRLSDAKAKAIYEGTQRGVLHMHEILSNEGVW